jgi:alkylhydroperoxidase/carboxymuconolactone decarboxylase family protein YurZ
MRLLAEYFPEFSQKLDEIDELYKEKRTIDEKIYQFICFALAIKNRSVPCVLEKVPVETIVGFTMSWEIIRNL